MKEKQWYVYLIECRDGSYYTGITNNLDKRMNTHALGKGSKYVARKGFKELLKTQECDNKSDAGKAEYYIKQLTRQEKLTWFSVN